MKKTHIGISFSEIQALMGMLLFVPNGIGTSPYKCLLDSEMWVEIYEIFKKDACTLIGITVNSPLTTCLNAGCMAIPALLNIKQVMMQRQVHGIWNGKDELPVSLRDVLCLHHTKKRVFSLALD